MTFEVFTRTSHNRSMGQPTVTVDVHGSMRLNPGALDVLGNPTRVELLWDAEGQTAALRSSTEESGDSYKVDSSRRVSARAFTSAYAIPRSTRYPAQMSGNLLTFHRLDPKAITVSSNRANRVANGPASEQPEAPVIEG